MLLPTQCWAFVVFNVKLGSGGDRNGNASEVMAAICHQPCGTGDRCWARCHTLKLPVPYVLAVNKDCHLATVPFGS